MQKEDDYRARVESFIKIDTELDAGLVEFWDALDNGTVAKLIPPGVMKLAEEIVRKEEKENTMTKDTDKRSGASLEQYLTDDLTRQQLVTSLDDLCIRSLTYEIAPDYKRHIDNECTFMIQDKLFHFTIDDTEAEKSQQKHTHTTIYIWPDTYKHDSIHNKAARLEVAIQVNGRVVSPHYPNVAVSLRGFGPKTQRNAVMALIAKYTNLEPIPTSPEATEE